MGKYKVISGQNIYDVALHIYGSIEGITDLMINNPDLSMADTLKDGDEIIYSDDVLLNEDIAAWFSKNKVTPSGGERHVYFKETNKTLVAEIRLPGNLTAAGFTAAGTGTMVIDWGDNSSLQEINLDNQPELFHHSFDNTIASERKVRFYGDFRWRQVDLTELTPSSVFILVPIYTEELSLNNCSASLDFLQMLHGTYSINLKGMKVQELSPLVECREVMTVDLTGMKISRKNLDMYLMNLVRKHYGRRNCAVYLSEEPSGEYCQPQRDQDMNYIINTGMEAIWLLCNEPSWNEGGLWSFHINGKTFTYESDNQGNL